MRKRLRRLISLDLSPLLAGHDSSKRAQNQKNRILYGVLVEAPRQAIEPLVEQRETRLILADQGH